ncbi:MAG TPA: hypothetical protein VF710_21610 [Longimicrobium sp.]
MRTLPLLVATILLLASPRAARAQSVGGGIGVSAQVVAAEELKLASTLGGGAGTEQVRVERTRGGDASLSVPLVLTHRARPVVSLQQRAGDPPCELLTAAVARTDAGWGTRLRCTTNPAGAPQWARVLIVPNT